MSGAPKSPITLGAEQGLYDRVTVVKSPVSNDCQLERSLPRKYLVGLVAMTAIVADSRTNSQ